MDILRRIRSKCNLSIDDKDRAKMAVRSTMPADEDDDEFDISGRTAGVDISYRSAFEFDMSHRSACGGNPSTGPAKVIGDTSGLTGRHLKSCLKVRTQRDSLARISQLVLPYTPTIMETTNKGVRFDLVEFREYRRALSDNPTSSGPPIGIDWGYDPKDTIILDLDMYETDRDGYRRHKKELAIPSSFREEMLIDAGYSRYDIRLATRRARKDKERRNASFHQQKFDPLLERLESVKYGAKRMISTKR
ncbi:hypothetical protein ACHAXR_003010 [Thalassiosira sp. AJA248-18]